MGTYSIAMDGDFPGECLCGSIDFERIVMQRRPNAPLFEKQSL